MKTLGYVLLGARYCGAHRTQHGKHFGRPQSERFISEEARAISINVGELMANEISFHGISTLGVASLWHASQ